MTNQENMEQQTLPITITPEAIAEVKRLAAGEKDEKLYLRLGVAAGGCSGMSYNMAFDTEKDNNDLLFTVDNFDILIDNKALTYLSGTVLDYKGGMLGGGFTFSNPNAKRSCGCGTSFSC